MTGTMATRDGATPPTFGSGPDATGSPAPPPGPAIDHAPTRAALGRHGRRALVFLAAGVALLAVAAGLAVVGAPDQLWLWVGGFGVAGLVAGPALGVRWRWMRAVLGRSPWVARRGRFHIVRPRFELDVRRRNLWAVLILEADEHGPEVLCTVPEMRSRLDALAAPGGPVDVWVAGDPERKGVATVDGSDVVPIRRPRMAWWRGVLRKRVERQIAAQAEGAATRRS